MWLQIDEVVDSIVVSLSKFSSVLHFGTPKVTVVFGENEKARLALETMFTIANRLRLACFVENLLYSLLHCA